MSSRLGQLRAAVARIRRAARPRASLAGLLIVAALAALALGATSSRSGHAATAARASAGEGVLAPSPAPLLASRSVPAAAHAASAAHAAAPAGFQGTLAAAGPIGELRYRVVGCRGSDTAAYRNGPTRYQVALGFDDGPAPDTPAFVRMLERNRAHATFFVIGREVSGGYRETLLRELRDGDAIGDHSFTHPDLTRVPNPRAQLLETIEVVRALTGYTPCVFRPPYGAYDDSLVRTAAALGLATVLWDVDPTDWKRPGVRAIERTVLEEVRPGSIVISHDGGGPRGQTLAAYPHIIAALRARGYGLVTIPQLLGLRLERPLLFGSPKRTVDH